MSQYPSRPIVQKGERVRRVRGMGIGLPLPKADHQTTGAATKSEQERLDKITQMGCILSFYKTGKFGTPGAVHHLITGRIPGRRNKHRMTICLSPRYHQYSPEALHDLGIKRFAELHGISEWQLWELTNKLVETFP